jgi:ribosomal protein L15E
MGEKREVWRSWREKKERNRTKQGLPTFSQMRRLLFYKQKSTVVYPGRVNLRGTARNYHPKSWHGVYLWRRGGGGGFFLGSPGSFITWELVC